VGDLRTPQREDGDHEGGDRDHERGDREDQEQGLVHRARD
jgi:hypothetical protein